MKLSPTKEKFVLHWGEMGSRWGVNRTVAQIHALLYLAGRPLTADEIVETLGVARSNVSTSLKELQSWGLVRIVHQIGDRRDHFVSQQDVWDIFLTIVEGRKHRELEPTLTTLRDCVLEARDDSEMDRATEARITATMELLEQLLGWYDQMKRLDRKTQLKIIKLGAQIQALIGKG